MDTLQFMPITNKNKTNKQKIIICICTDYLYTVNVNAYYVNNIYLMVLQK